MEKPIVIQSDPKDYAFKKFIDEQKHLDCDEHRHKIKPIVHIIDKDFKGQEHLFCDKSQRDADGKFRRPKKLVEAERRGFKSSLEMYEADKKAEEDKKVKETEDMKKRLDDKEKQIELLNAKLEAMMKLTEERFNKVATLLSK
jgi:hypothetical protein